MSQDQSSGWFLDVDGQKTGPFHLDHVLGLIRDRELLPHHKVTALHLNGHWYRVQDLIDAHAAESAPAAAQSIPFQPPPRPMSIENPGVLDKKSDPIANLFDALQAIKERKPTRPPEVKVKRDRAPVGPRVPVLVVTVLVCVGLVWAMINFLRKAPILNGAQPNATNPVQRSVPNSAPPASAPLVTAPRQAPLRPLNAPARPYIPQPRSADEMRRPDEPSPPVIGGEPQNPTPIEPGQIAPLDSDPNQPQTVQPQPPQENQAPPPAQIE